MTGESDDRYACDGESLGPLAQPDGPVRGLATIADPAGNAVGIVADGPR